jgi:hypothetical protein
MPISSIPLARLTEALNDFDRHDNSQANPFQRQAHEFSRSLRSHLKEREENAEGINRRSTFKSHAGTLVDVGITGTAYAFGGPILGPTVSAASNIANSMVIQPSIAETAENDLQDLKQRTKQLIALEFEKAKDKAITPQNVEKLISRALKETKGDAELQSYFLLKSRENILSMLEKQGDQYKLNEKEVKKTLQGVNRKEFTIKPNQKQRAALRQTHDQVKKVSQYYQSELFGTAPANPTLKQEIANDPAIKKDLEEIKSWMQKEDEQRQAAAERQQTADTLQGVNVAFQGVALVGRLTKNEDLEDVAAVGSAGVQIVGAALLASNPITAAAGIATAVFGLVNHFQNREAAKRPNPVLVELGKVKKRLKKLDKKIDAQFKAMGIEIRQGFRDIGNKIDSRFDKVDTKLDQISVDIARVYKAVYTCAIEVINVLESQNERLEGYLKSELSELKSLVAFGHEESRQYLMQIHQSPFTAQIYTITTKSYESPYFQNMTWETFNNLLNGPQGIVYWGDLGASSDVLTGKWLLQNSTSSAKLGYNPAVMKAIEDRHALHLLGYLQICAADLLRSRGKIEESDRIRHFNITNPYAWLDSVNAYLTLRSNVSKYNDKAEIQSIKSEVKRLRQHGQDTLDFIEMMPTILQEVFDDYWSTIRKIVDLLQALEKSIKDIWTTEPFKRLDNEKSEAFTKFMNDHELNYSKAVLIGVKYWKDLRRIPNETHFPSSGLTWQDDEIRRTCSILDKMESELILELKKKMVSSESMLALLDDLELRATLIKLFTNILCSNEAFTQALKDEQAREAQYINKVMLEAAPKELIPTIALVTASDLPLPQLIDKKNMQDLLSAITGRETLEKLITNLTPVQDYSKYYKSMLGYRSPFANALLTFFSFGLASAKWTPSKPPALLSVAVDKFQKTVYGTFFLYLKDSSRSKLFEHMDLANKLLAELPEHLELKLAQQEADKANGMNAAMHQAAIPLIFTLLQANLYSSYKAQPKPKPQPQKAIYVNLQVSIRPYRDEIKKPVFPQGLRRSVTPWLYTRARSANVALKLLSIARLIPK